MSSSSGSSFTSQGRDSFEIGIEAYVTLLSELHNAGAEADAAANGVGGTQAYAAFINAALCSRVTQTTSIYDIDRPIRAEINTARDDFGTCDPVIVRDYDSAIGIVENVNLQSPVSLSTTVNFQGTIASPLHISGRAFNAQVGFV